MSSNANLSPFLRSDEPVNIAALFSPDGVTPVKCTLDDHLRNLYRALFAFSGSDEISLISMRISYASEINEIIDNYTPILLIPHLTLCANAAGEGNFVEDFCTQLADECEKSFSSKMPHTDQGRFVFAFTLMSGNNEGDLALLDADNLYLSFTYISAAN